MHDVNGRETRGVMYIATGAEHIRRAIGSAASVRKHNPDLPIHLFADWQRHAPDLARTPGPFTSWENIEDPHRRSKVDLLGRTLFKRTLFLDTDTRVVSSLDDLFDVLDRFDVALAHAHKRASPLKQRTLRLVVPEAFPQFNSGVFLFRKTEAVLRVLRQWQEWFRDENVLSDQKTLREILWASDLRIATLPPEYNVRFIKYLLLWSRDEAQPKILHLPYYKEGLLTYLKRWRTLILRSLRKVLPG